MFELQKMYLLERERGKFVVYLSVFFRGEKIHTSVQRMFRIWKERKVYDNGFLRELEQLIGMWKETIRIQQRICFLSTMLYFLSLRTTLTESTS